MTNLEDFIKEQKLKSEVILHNPKSERGLSVETIQNTLASATGGHIENPDLSEDINNEIKARTIAAEQDGYIIAALGFPENVVNVLKAVPTERMLDIFKRDSPTISANIPYFLDLVVTVYESEGKHDAVKQIYKTLPAAIKRVEKALGENYFGEGHSYGFALESLELLKKYNEIVKGK
jgi:hypothetical protein